MATQFNISEMNMNIKTAREVNFPLARSLLHKNSFFTDPTDFGLANQISLAIVAKFSPKDEYTMFQTKIDKLNPQKQVLYIRAVAIQKQANQMENLNFLFPSEGFTKTIHLYRTLGQSYIQVVENDKVFIDETFLRYLPPPLNSSSPEIQNQIKAMKAHFVAAFPEKNSPPANTDISIAFNPQYIEGSALDILELSKIVEELKLPTPSPAT